MKRYFQQLSIEQKIIYASTALALLSLFFTWVKLFDFKQNGFEQGIYPLLLIFIYPFVQVLRGKQIRKKYGYIHSFFGIVLGLSYLAMRTINEPGIYYIAWGSGPILFIIASIGIGIGTWKSKENEEQARM